MARRTGGSTADQTILTGAVRNLLTASGVRTPAGPEAAGSRRPERLASKRWAISCDGAMVSRMPSDVSKATSPGVGIEAWVDGNLVWSVAASSSLSIPSQPHEIILNLQVASQQTSGCHTVPTATSPGGSLKVAEVRAYS